MNWLSQVPTPAALNHKKLLYSAKTNMHEKVEWLGWELGVQNFPTILGFSEIRALGFYLNQSSDLGKIKHFYIIFLLSSYHNS